MPELCRFHGIRVRMYYDDHNPPHVHARFGRDEACIEISSGDVLQGSLPPRALRFVVEWTEIHRESLAADWERAMRHEPLEPILPLE